RCTIKEVFPSWGTIKTKCGLSPTSRACSVAVHNFPNVRRMYPGHAMNVPARPRLFLLAPKFSSLMLSVIYAKCKLNGFAITCWNWVTRPECFSRRCSLTEHREKLKKFDDTRLLFLPWDAPPD